MTTPDSQREVGLKEAAELAGLSLSTMRRRREELRKNGATQHSDGTWSIPIDTLIACQMLDHVTPTVTTPVAPPDAHVAPEVDALRAQLAEAEKRAMDAEKRAAVAEAVADERGRALDAERALMRMLTERPAPAPEPERPAPAPEPDTTTPAPEPPVRASFWSRLLGG